MAHLTVRSAYKDLTDRLNLYPQGAPPSDALYHILQLLFSEVEAALVARLPIKPFSAKKAAGIWKKTEAEARKTLEALADRGILVDSPCQDGKMVYCLPPPMAGFFEFSMMRLRGDIDQKLLAELFYQYLNVEEEFIKQLFCTGETQLGRVFVAETALTAENSLHVLDYERASEVVKTASHIGVGICYCRHKMEHVGRACAAERDICLTFNSTASSLSRHGIVRKIDAAEGLDLLQKARGQNLVQFGENVREAVHFICNCCGCCCQSFTLLISDRLSLCDPSRYRPQVDPQACLSCGTCEERCWFDAIKADEKSIAVVIEEKCLGCGQCAIGCPEKAITMIEIREPGFIPE